MRASGRSPCLRCLPGLACRPGSPPADPSWCLYLPPAALPDGAPALPGARAGLYARRLHAERRLEDVMATSSGRWTWPVARPRSWWRSLTAGAGLGRRLVARRREALFAQGRYGDGQRLTALTLPVVDATGAARDRRQPRASSWTCAGAGPAWHWPSSIILTVRPASCTRWTWPGAHRLCGWGQVSVLGTLAAGAARRPLPRPPCRERRSAAPLRTWSTSGTVGRRQRGLLHATDGGQH